MILNTSAKLYLAWNRRAAGRRFLPLFIGVNSNDPCPGSLFAVPGGRVRVVAKLFSVETGSLVKSIKIDYTVGGVFDLQDKIVFSLMAESGEIKVADVKKPVVTNDEKTKIETKTRFMLFAYEYYARGWR
jgi:hypothetical protein